jgi:hypothetical protein
MPGMNNAIAVALAMISLAACSTTNGETGEAATTETGAARGTIAAAPTASFDAPRVTSPGTSPISPGIQLAFCQDQVADMVGAKRENAVTGERIVASDGATTIDVTVTKVDEGVRTFKCRLDANNRFIEVVAATTEAVL